MEKETVEQLQQCNISGAESKKHAKINRQPMPYGKVLIVDDMKSNLDVARLLLVPYQLQIETASNGFEAIEKIKNGKTYDIIFLDHMMPGMDGIETAAKLREQGYHYPIIALTANADAEQKDVFLANGFNGFISKPIDIRQMNNCLNTFILDNANGHNGDAGGISSQQLEGKGLAMEIHQMAIAGINQNAGLSLYEGDTDIYLSVMRSFVPNATSNIEKLRNISKESAGFTLEDYAIYIHGMKSICANIGADALKHTAARLETLSKAGDLDAVLAENDAFIKNAETVIAAVQSWLQEHAGEGKKRLAFPDTSLLARLLEYCKAYDIDGVDEIMDQLENTDYDNDGSLIQFLREKINASDFSSAEERLSQYLG